MRIITLPLLDKFFNKLLNGDKKFKKISTENLEADEASVTNGLSAGTITSGAITCTTINTQNNNINAGTITSGAITCTTINTQNNNINAGTGVVSGRIRIPTTAPANPQPGDIWIS